MPPPKDVPEPESGICPEDPSVLKCPQCKATSGWCTEDNYAGCPCGKKQDGCPALEDAPTCQDDDCKGEVNENDKDKKPKCTTVRFCGFSCISAWKEED